MSEVKVNKISPRSGTDVTLGDSGDTFTIPSGATINNQGTAVNFGATGSASWVTTVKTSTFTAVAGEGYFINTTGGVVSVNLPAGTAGAVVAIKDYAGTFDTNAVTLVQNGSDKIGGSTVNATLSTEGLAVTLVFIDSTQGWLVTDNGTQDTAPTSQYVTATGGTITCSGDFKIHTFTGPGALCVSCAGNAAGSNQLEYLVVAGGGGGGDTGCRGGGGGAGGFRFASPSIAPLTYPGKPLAGSTLTASVASIPITIGAGGAGGTNGNNSIFSSITSTAGGGGAGGSSGGDTGGSGGGGGGPGGGSAVSNGGAGNTPPVSPSQGNNGGPGDSSPPGFGGGGGGALAVGSTGASSPQPRGADGGIGGGLPTAFGSNGVPCGSFRYYAGGGGGGYYGDAVPGGLGGTGGGGNGAGYNGSSGTPGTGGTTNTGGGGGGETLSGLGGYNGGSGIVIIRYKFQN